MSFDMRISNGRCPLLLLGGCTVLYILLLCKWWSLSTQNDDLLNQFHIIEEQMKICSTGKDQCINDQNKLEVIIDELKIKRDQEISKQENALKKKDITLVLCNTELESLKIVDASKTQSLDTLRSTLEEKKEEIKRLNEQIRQLTSITTDGNMPRSQKYTITNLKETDINDKNEVDDGTSKLKE